MIGKVSDQIFHTSMARHWLVPTQDFCIIPGYAVIIQHGLFSSSRHSVVCWCQDLVMLFEAVVQGSSCLSLNKFHVELGRLHLVSVFLKRLPQLSFAVMDWSGAEKIAKGFHFRVMLQ